MVERITITMKKDMLKRVDAMIDRREIRNRSHAIESLLAKSLGGTGLDTALIMAGEGEEIKFNRMPKSLVPIAGRPVLEHQIDLLRMYGIKKILIASDYTVDRIRQYFGSGRAHGVDITYLHEERPMGTAGAIGLAGDHVEGSFIMLNADTLMDPNIHEIYDFHKKHKKIATVMLTTTADPSHFGVVKMRGSQIIRFVEKPRPLADTSRLINAGFCVFDKKVCEMIPKRKMMIEELFIKLCNQGQLMGFLHDGIAFDVGTRDGYEKAVKQWSTIRNL